MSQNLRMSREEFEKLKARMSNISVKEIAATKGQTFLKPRMNKTEASFFEILRRRYDPRDIFPFGLTLELAYRCKYTPDFSVIQLGAGGYCIVTCYEVKGAHVFEDSWIKLKVAARTFSNFKFVLAQYKKGEWTETVISPNSTQPKMRLHRE